MLGTRYRSPWVAAGGGALVLLGATGRWPDLNGSSTNGDSKAALANSRGVLVDDNVIVNRPAAELYADWRKLTPLPRYMSHLTSVECVDDRISHWVAKAPAGYQVEWDAEIINDVPDQRIGW